ncbi:SIMPL domain-containing protein [Aestuariicoccus sp. MJ-SS9]|uniref:SIMPL domain-containing protein n=1 Tax=Aestuariicoccus sp. MJ-SS9 TaxID=3079855 RepID=UPI002913ABDC|nr:SIMPL domain-containing protein [Aestuariicoccus sp. MJ-SS9]MDU8912880.1 SIMPL domain-containing protein [Aestuariicoccus sp. MJ-SS9]
MPRIVLLLVWILSAGALYAQEPAQPTLTVTGEGQAAAVPDMATITLGVTAQSENAAEAMDQTSEAVAAILERLDGLGLQPRDIQTSDVSLNPIWSRRMNNDTPPRIEGFEASNRLRLRVRDLEKLGVILEAALEDGANRLGGLSFGLRDPDPVMDEARAAAVADAQRRARVYAQAAGVTLGPVLRIHEGGEFFPVEAPMMEMARAADVPIATGETSLTARVTMVFALEQ